MIAGTITDETGEAVIGATVRVKNESTGFSTGTVTNLNGEYSIKQLPLGSPYSVWVSYIGFGEQRKTGYALNQGDMLKVDFQLTIEAQQIQAVEVVANSLKNTTPDIGAATSVGSRDTAEAP
jgi:hypothetical protein